MSGTSTLNGNLDMKYTIRPRRGSLGANETLIIDTATDYVSSS